jgi:hypothetical protein
LIFEERFKENPSNREVEKTFATRSIKEAYKICLLKLIYILNIIKRSLDISKTDSFTYIIK